jgi:hypothetical protein
LKLTNASTDYFFLGCLIPFAAKNEFYYLLSKFSGKMRMTLPCRASTCDHLQCFDANLYLKMNEKKAKWLCPVCNKPALYDNLLLDGFFNDVLASTR